MGRFEYVYVIQKQREVNRHLCLAYHYIWVYRSNSHCKTIFPTPQNSIVSIKELCGLPPIASLKQCILTLSSRLINSDNTPSVTLCMKDTFPYLEPLGTTPDVQKKVLAAYDLVRSFISMSLSFLLLLLCFG